MRHPRWEESRLSSAGLLVGLALLSSACDARLGSSASDPDATSPGTGDPVSAELIAASNEEVPLSEALNADPETLQDGVPESSRVLRLTYGEYDAVVSELLHLPVDASQLFPTEEPTLGAYEERPILAIGDRLLTELRNAAEELADTFVTTPDAYAQYVSCPSLDEACRDAFVAEFAFRAYRRPATDAELTRLKTLFDSGAELVASGDDFRDGVQLVTEAILQSAKFLYRAEEGSGVVSDAGEELSDFELASRLSFLLWGTMPDAELFAEATAGTLRENLSAQVDRMLASPNLATRIQDFHDRWLHLEDSLLASKDPSSFPDFSPELAADMVEETRGFIREISMSQNGGIVELLTSPYAYVNSSLAAHYGLPGSFGDAHASAEFAPESGRKGLLTQGAFLIGHSSASTRTSPILRGVFLNHNVLCNEIPEPPPGAEMEEPDEPLAADAVTTRDYFEWKTSMSSCAGCHDLINPIGFAFEHFDAVGSYRDMENGAPVDATGSTSIEDTEVSFANATEAIDAIAEQPITRLCYARQWLNYLYGRHELAGDLQVLAYGSQGLAAPDFGARGVISSITEGAAFSHLSPILD